MKSKFSRILGVGLTIAVLASMLVVSSPASAGTLAWSSETGPGPTALPLVSGSDIVDVAAASNGTTVYAAGGMTDLDPSPTVATALVKSTNGGTSWTAVNLPATANVTNVKRVALGPDMADGSFVAVIATAGLGVDTVFISSDGGATWASTIPGGVLTAIDVSRPIGTVRSMAVVSGTSIMTLDLGGLFGGVWTATAATGFAGGTPLAVEYSPNYAGDRTLAVVTTGTDIRLQLYNVTNQAWNGAVYGVPWTGGGLVAAATTTSAALALSPSFLGADSSSRIAYVGTTGGLFRVSDPGAPSSTQLGAGTVFSVAVNAAGDKLVAGGVTGVLRVASPATAAANSAAGSPTIKSPGVDAAGMISVAFAGTNVVAGSTGAESAFSRSADDGRSFNAVSLVDSTLVTKDIAVSPDGSRIYLVSVSAASNLSLWRKTTAWERVLVTTGALADYVVRSAPDNADVVYLGVTGAPGGQILYSNDGGQATWLTRFSPHTIVDMAVQSAAVVYILNNGAQVSKSVDSGFIWDNPRVSLPTPFSTAAGGTISVVSADNIVVGGGDGNVAYSTNGGTSWTRIAAPVAGVAQVTASGLASGGFIYATTNAATGSVYRWTIGTSTSWTNMLGSTGALTGDGTTPANLMGRGIALSGGALYVVADNAPTDNRTFLYRSIAPSTAASAGSFSKTVASVVLMDRPQALLVSAAADKNPKLWGVTTAGGVQSFTDILVTASPAFSLPADRFENPINPETGFANNVVFQWTAVAGTPAATTTYNLQIALDSGFTQTIFNGTGIAKTLVILGQNNAPDGMVVFQADTQYFWRVRIDGPVFSPFQGTPRSFKTGALRPLSLQSPANGAGTVSVNPTFVWSPATGATTYELVVSDDPTFAIITFSRTTSQPVFASDEQLAYNTVYYWRVRASAPAAAVTPFVTGIFTTEPRPVTVTTTPVPPVTVTQTSVTVTVPPATTVDVIPSYLLWIIIGIGAILVIALIVLIVRTRRTG